MFEHHHEPLLTRTQFALRLLRGLGAGAIVVAASLAIGTVGYHYFADLPWIDALLNASMILTGMGPIDPMRTTIAKLFATAYALFSGVVFLTLVALILGPIAHRLLHHFHLTDEDLDKKPMRKHD